MINQNIRVGMALQYLGVIEFSLHGEPTNEAEFLQYFYKSLGTDDKGHAIMSNDPKDFGVTWEQIKEAMEELSVQYVNNEYQRQRVKEYPSVVDQLDLLYHGEFDAWKAAIKAVKDKYPKS